MPYLAGDNGLHEETKHGEHSKSTILDLLDLQLSERVGVVSQAEGVEGATWVQAVHKGDK